MAKPFRVIGTSIPRRSGHSKVNTSGKYTRYPITLPRVVGHGQVDHSIVVAPRLLLNDTAWRIEAGVVVADTSQKSKPKMPRAPYNQSTVSPDVVYRSLACCGT